MMKAYFNFVQSSLEILNQNVTQKLLQLCSQDRAAETAVPESQESLTPADEKLRRELWRAKHRVSQARLEAFVATLSPKEREENEREGKRLSPQWQLPRAEKY